jgi:DNA-binding MarR family transcriptional regulator
MSEHVDEPDIAALAHDIRMMLRRLRRRLQEESEVAEFTPSQLAVLARLERDGTGTVSALARAEGVKPQSMGPIIAALESVGFVASSPHPTDGRQTLYSLTPAAIEFYRVNRAARDDWLSRSIRAHYSSTEQHDLGDAVNLMMRLLEP